MQSYIFYFYLLFQVNTKSLINFIKLLSTNFAYLCPRLTIFLFPTLLLPTQHYKRIANNNNHDINFKASEVITKTLKLKKKTRILPGEKRVKKNDLWALLSLRYKDVVIHLKTDIWIFIEFLENNIISHRAYVNHFYKNWTDRIAIIYKW